MRYPIQTKVLVSSVMQAAGLTPQSRFRLRSIGHWKTGGPRIFRDKGQGRESYPFQDFDAVAPKRLQGHTYQPPEVPEMSAGGGSPEMEESDGEEQ